MTALVMFWLLALVSVTSLRPASGQGAVSTHHQLGFDGSSSKAWHYGRYPNPQVNVNQCGRGKKSWICDPDKILKPENADELDALITDIMSDTPCPCSAHLCSHDKGSAPGYKVAIAIMDKMYRSSQDMSTLLTDAREFTFGLEKDRWNFDRCDEDVTIIYSRLDQIVFSVTGSKAREKLTDEKLYEITMDSQRFFRHNEFMGLKHMLYGIRAVFEDRYQSYVSERHHLARIYSYQRVRSTNIHHTYSGGNLGKGVIISAQHSSAATVRASLVAFILVLTSVVVHR